MTTPNGMPRSVWVCGSKKISAWVTAVGRGAVEIGDGEIAEILLGPQHAAP